MNLLTHARTHHLTEEQLYDLLDRQDAASATLHLRTCARCQAEFSTLREAFANLRTATTALAAAEAAPALSRRILTPAPRPAIWRRPAWSASFASAAALLALGLTLLHPHTPVHTPGVPAAPVSAGNDSAAADDALLNNIQQDLSTSIPPSLQPLAVPASSSDSATEN